MIGFPLPDTKTVLTLFLAADTHLLSKYEYAMYFPGLGDTTVEFVYNAYRRDEKLGWAPTGYRILLAGKDSRRLFVRRSGWSRRVWSLQISRTKLAAFAFEIE